MSWPRAARWAAVAAAATAIAWLGALASPYHYDDFVTPLEDPASQSLGALGNHLITTLRPLTKLTYALESSLGLTSAVARHAGDIAIHAAAAGVLVLLLAALRVALRPAAACGVLWGVHPIHAESVIAVAGRSEALSGLLVLGALLAYAHRRYRAAAIVFALAVLARETALAAIVALVATELVGEPAPWRERARRLWPSAVAFVIVATWVVATPRVRELAGYSFEGMAVHDSLLAQLAAVPVGLTLYARPWALSLDHDAPHGTWLFAAAIALYVLALAGGFVALRRRHAAAIGIAVWLAAIVPTQSIVPKLDALSERPLALALAGIVIVLATTLPARARLAGALGFAAVLAIATWARTRVYGSDLSLWADAADKAHEHVRPHMMYAVFLHRANRDDDAQRELERASAIDPDDRQVRAALADLANKRKLR